MLGHALRTDRAPTFNRGGEQGRSATGAWVADEVVAARVVADDLAHEPHRLAAENGLTLFSFRQTTRHDGRAAERSPLRHALCPPDDGPYTPLRGTISGLPHT